MPKEIAFTLILCLEIGLLVKRYVWLFSHTVNRSVLNLKSQDTIARDFSTHGAMLVPVIAGSDKTTVSVATGHQEYHPVYISPGIFTNTARRGHGNAVLPVAFLPIPKSMSYLLSLLFLSFNLYSE